MPPQNHEKLRVRRRPRKTRSDEKKSDRIFLKLQNTAKHHAKPFPALCQSSSKPTLCLSSSLQQLSSDDCELLLHGSLKSLRHLFQHLCNFCLSVRNGKMGLVFSMRLGQERSVFQIIILRHVRTLIKRIGGQLEHLNNKRNTQQHQLTLFDEIGRPTISSSYNRSPSSDSSSMISCGSVISSLFASCPPRLSNTLASWNASFFNVSESFFSFFFWNKPSIKKIATFNSPAIASSTNV
jgi:hypothetical protein